MKNFSLFAIAALLLHAQHSFGASFKPKEGKVDAFFYREGQSFVFYIPTTVTEKKKEEDKAWANLFAVKKDLNTRKVSAEIVFWNQTFPVENHFVAPCLLTRSGQCIYFTAEGAFNEKEHISFYKKDHSYVSERKVSNDDIVQRIISNEKIL